MPIVPLDITGPSYDIPFSPVTSNQQCINMFPITANPTNALQAENPLYDGRGKATLVPTAGFDYLSGPHSSGALTDGCYGLYVQKVTPAYTTAAPYSVAYRVFAIFKGVLWELNITTNGYLISTLTATNRGALSDNSPYIAKFTDNGTELLIEWGISTRLYNMNTNVLTVNPQGATIPNGRIPGLACIDGYFFLAQIDTDQFYASNVNDGLTWAATSTARMQSKPDVLITFAQTKSELWGFGTQSIEIWYDAANAAPGMPFSKRLGSDMDIGTVSPFSVQTINDKLYWVDNRGYVVTSDFNQFFRSQSSGYQITKVSDDAIDAAIAEYPVLKRIIGSTYIDRGHVMYEITLPSITGFTAPNEFLNVTGRTFVFDINTSMWHEKQYTNPSTGAVSEAYTHCYAQIGNLILAGSPHTNNLYVLGSTVTIAGGVTSYAPGAYTDNDDPIYRYRRTKLYNNDYKQITVNSLEIKCLTGQIASGSPTIDMRFSNDSGFTWSSWLSRSLGTAGDYDARIIWNLLGTAHEWMFEFRVAANTNFSIVDAIANVTPEGG